MEHLSHTRDTRDTRDAPGARGRSASRAEASADRPALWSEDNLSVLLPLTALLLALVAAGLVGRPLSLLPGEPARIAADAPPAAAVPEIGEIIDPDSADWPSLCRLPGIGPVKAKAICDYRQRRRQAGWTGRVFTCPQDLQAVSGIGPETAAQAAPWLTFLIEGDPRAPMTYNASAAPAPLVGGVQP